MKLPAAALAALLASNSVCSEAQQAAAPTATSAPATPPVEKPVVILPNTLMDGTEVKMKLVHTITSADATTGQRVPFEVTDDVLVDGKVVIAKGSPAMATVTDAHSKRNMGRAGKLDVGIDSARLVTGEKVPLRASKDSQGGSHVGAMTGAMIATSIVFFPAAPLFLFMKGKDIVIPEGTVITAYVEGDLPLDAPKAVVVADSAGGSLATLVVESSVTGADITVDGNFMGNTPSTLSLTPGPHTVLVQKKGYADWTRTMNVAGSGARLNADLDAKP